MTDEQRKATQGKAAAGTAGSSDSGAADEAAIAEQLERYWQSLDSAAATRAGPTTASASSPSSTSPRTCTCFGSTAKGTSSRSIRGNRGIGTGGLRSKNDEATAALMRLFYRNLWVEELPPIEALRQAQLAIYRHPEQVGELARSRGLDFEHVVELTEQDPAGEPGTTASPALWAGFVLSGAGR